MNTDCHVHVFEAGQTLIADRDYDPPSATLDALAPLHNGLGIKRVVFVQPSVCGTDNSSVLAGLARYGKRARGVVVVEEDVTGDDLAMLHGAGVRGIRINRWNRSTPALDDDAAIRLGKRVCELGWHVEVVAPFGHVAALIEQLDCAVVPHFGLGEIPLDAFDAGNLWVKLSAPYQVRDADRLAERLLQAVPGRCVWGTDWPHVNQSGPPPDLNVMRWLRDEATRQLVLVDNPTELYRFEDVK